MNPMVTSGRYVEQCRDSNVDPDRRYDRCDNAGMRREGGPQNGGQFEGFHRPAANTGGRIGGGTEDALDSTCMSPVR